MMKDTSVGPMSHQRCVPGKPEAPDIMMSLRPKNCNGRNGPLSGPFRPLQFFVTVALLFMSVSGARPPQRYRIPEDTNGAAPIDFCDTRGFCCLCEECATACAIQGTKCPRLHGGQCELPYLGRLPPEEKLKCDVPPVMRADADRPGACDTIRGGKIAVVGSEQENYKGYGWIGSRGPRGSGTSWPDPARAERKEITKQTRWTLNGKGYSFKNGKKIVVRDLQYTHLVEQGTIVVSPSWCPQHNLQHKLPRGTSWCHEGQQPVRTEGKFGVWRQEAVGVPRTIAVKNCLSRRGPSIAVS